MRLRVPVATASTSVSLLLCVDVFEEEQSFFVRIYDMTVPNIWVAADLFAGFAGCSTGSLTSSGCLGEVPCTGRMLAHRHQLLL